jgi:hypothetical protein
MYLIPKNIKVKREVFKGYGIKEIAFVFISFCIGYLISFLGGNHIIKLLFFSVPSILSILITLPLPNGLTVFKIIQKYIKFNINQKVFKKV